MAINTGISQNNGWDVGVSQDAGTASASNIKTINNIVIANIKTVNNIAISSVKSWNGFQQ